MVRVIERKEVPVATVTCRNCKSVLEYGNADISPYYPHYSNPYEMTLRTYEAYYFRCPVCGVEVEVSKVSPKQ